MYSSEKRKVISQIENLDNKEWHHIDSALTSTAEETFFHKVKWKEIIIYHIFYWSCVLYSLYQFFLGCLRWRKRLPLTHREGVLGAYQDQNDLEWNVFIPLILEYAPFAILHLLLSQAIRKWVPGLLCLFYSIFSFAMLIKAISLVGAVICVSVPVLMLMIVHTRVKTYVWLMWCLILIVFNMESFQAILSNWLSDILEGEYKASVMLAWIILRSLSFCLDVCDEDPTGLKYSSSYLINLLAYCLYFPLLFTGPYMPYEDFKEGVNKSYELWNLPRLFNLFVQVLRFSAWLFLNEFLLHYFYSHSFQFIPSQLLHLDSWQLGGFTYFLLIFFYLKYVVYYGLPSVFAKAEGFEPPRHPTCVLIVCKMSDVWRNFDLGLYRFMIKQIYIPFINNENSIVKQIQGSVIVFTFVYVWHGVSPSVFYWSALNFCAVTLDKISVAISLTDSYRRWEKKYLPGAWARRFHAALYAPILLGSVIALVSFLSSAEASWIVFDRIVKSGFPYTTITVYCVFYCICQCGMTLNNWRKRQRSSTYAQFCE